MYQIYHNISIDANKDKVFEYCSEAAHINNWWTRRCNGSPILDEQYMFWFSPEYDWRAKVTRILDKNEIAFTFFQADEDWMSTVLSFRVEGRPNGTLLHMKHTNWKKDNEHYGRTSYCWAMYLLTLKRYVENGEVVAYENRGGS